MRRAKPLNAASLLINEDQRVVALDRLLVGADECADLLRRLAVPRKQDQTAGPFRGKEMPLFVAELQPGAA
jgi:hypothetical protein